MAIDDKTPVSFILPDGDTVQLCTWAFILDKLSEPLGRINTALAAINNDIDSINIRVDYWLSQQNDQN